MARAATETQRAGLTGLEFGLAIPGTVGGAVWANAGAHDADIAGVLESARVLAADGAESHRPGRRARPRPTATAGSSTPPPAATPELIIEATFRLAAADPTRSRRRLDEIRRWRQAHQPLGMPSAGSVFRNPPGDSAGRLIEAAGLKGTPRSAAPSCREKHANFIVNDQKGTAADVRRLAEQVRAEVVAERPAIELELRDRVRRRLVAAGTPATVSDRARPPVVVLLGGPSAEHDVSIVSGTAIAEALAARGPRRRPGPDRPRRAVVVAAGRPPARRPARPPPTTTRRRSAPTARSRVGAAIDRLAARDPAPVVFIALHGPFGEDGTVQALLEAAGLRLHGLGRRGLGARHGQGALQADVPRARPAGRRLARGPRRPLGGATRTRVRAELDGVRRRRPATRG